MQRLNFTKNSLIKAITTSILTLLIIQPAIAELPELGSPDLVHYDPQTEAAFGRAFTTTLHTQYDLNYDPEVITYIRQVGHKVASQLGEPRHFRFYVINNPSINAFAGPNGIIGIHTGLILAAKDEDELASVIAHEIAHITQRHLSRRLEYQAKQGNAMQFATILAAILIGAVDPSAATPILMAGTGLNIENQLKNSRQHESEADSVGISLLHKSGYNPHAMSRFFARLALEGQNRTFNPPEILRSHPVTENRIAEAQNRADNMGQQSSKEINDSLQLIKLRLQRSIYIEEESIYHTTKLTPEQACYQSNLQTLDKNRETSNLTCLKKLAQSHPEQPLYTELLLEIFSQTDKPSKQLKSFVETQAEFQMALHPNNVGVLIRYGKLLLKLNQEEKAISLLINKTTNKKYQYLAHKLLAKTYANKKDFASSNYFYASSQFNIGNIEATKYFLEQAEKQNTNTNKLLTRNIMLLTNISNNLLNSNKKAQQKQ